MSTEDRENLFSYGTLQQEDVQLATFHRLLEGKPDVLIGYRVTMIPIRDQSYVATTGNTHHRNIEFTGAASDVVEGTVFTVTRNELEHADAYEAGADYKRVPVQLKSGLSSWVYLYIPQVQSIP